MIGISHIPCCYSYHGNHSDSSITSLSKVVLSSHLVQRFIGTIGISLLPSCYRNLATIATRRNLYKFFVLSCIEFIFDMEIP